MVVLSSFILLMFHGLFSSEYLPDDDVPNKQQIIMRIEDRLFHRGWVRLAMATRKCGNIYFPKYFMAVRKFTNISISKYFCTSVNINSIGSRSIHYSSFAVGGINLTLLFQQTNLTGGCSEGLGAF